MEKFDTCKRKSETSILEHIHDFEKVYFKCKKHGTIFPDDLLGYKLLKSANLPEVDEKIARSMVPDLKYESMIAQLKRMFNDKKPTNTKDNLRINEINKCTYEHSQYVEDNNEYEIYYAGRRYVPSYPPPHHP